MTHRFVISACILASLLGGTAHAHAPLNIRAERNAVRVVDGEFMKLAQRQISASDAKRAARRAYPRGEVVDISRRGNVYNVRMVVEGRVRVVRVDANTGRVIG